MKPSDGCKVRGGVTHAGAVAGVVADGVFAGAVDVAEGEGLGEKCYTFAVRESVAMLQCAKGAGNKACTLRADRGASFSISSRVHEKV